MSLCLKGLPDAILCENDVIIIGCIDAIRNKLEKKMPYDVSAAGFGGVGPGHWDNYNLTTVLQPVYIRSEAVASMMPDRTTHPELLNETHIISDILVGGSFTRIA